MAKIFKQIVDRLKKYKPDKVILFGSYAWGTPKAFSDVDLLVIKETRQPFYKRIPEVRNYLFDIERPFDILVLTPSEVQKRIRLGDLFIQQIVNQGQILYETTN